MFVGGITASVKVKETQHRKSAPYGFGETRVAALAFPTLTVLWGSRPSGVVTAKFAGHAVTLRRSPTVFADTPMSGSTSTRILSGKLPRANWSAATGS
jgi:hypothetical protein